MRQMEKTIYMPFTTHEQYEKQLEANNPGVDYEEGWYARRIA